MVPLANSSNSSSSSSSATALPDTPKRAELRGLIGKIHKLKSEESALCVNLSEKTVDLVKEGMDSKDASAFADGIHLIAVESMLITAHASKDYAYFAFAGVLTKRYLQRNGDITLLADEMFGKDDSPERQGYIQELETARKLLKG